MELEGRPAARKGDATEHGAPLGEGPGSPNVLIGGARAWRGKKKEEEEEEEEEGEGEGEGEGLGEGEGESLGEGEGESLGEHASVTEEGSALGEAAKGAEEAGSSFSALIEKLSEAEEQAKALIEVINAAKELGKKEDKPEDPAYDGPPEEADTSYEKGFELGKSIFELAMVIKEALAPTEPDEHTCEEEGHGSGPVEDGSEAVLINGLPACRKGDHVKESGGGEDEITEGCDSVLIGEGNKVLELAEKIGGLFEFVKAAKELFAKEEEAPKEEGSPEEGGAGEGDPSEGGPSEGDPPPEP